MLLQGQDDAIGNDGGQIMYSKRRGKGGIRNRITKEKDSLQDGYVHPYTNFINHSMSVQSA